MEKFTGILPTGFVPVFSAKILSDQGRQFWDGYLENDPQANFIVAYELGANYIVEVFQNQRQVRYYMFDYAGAAIRSFTTIKNRMARHMIGLNKKSIMMLDTCEKLSPSPFLPEKPNPFFGQVRRFSVYNPIVWDIQSSDDIIQSNKVMTEVEWNNRLWKMIRDEGGGA